jgi:hypothetical protein
MALNKTQRDKLVKDVQELWKTSPAKALKLLVKTAKFKSKKQV